jgi:hypothetical protein
MALSIRAVEYMESLLWKYSHAYMDSVPTCRGYSGTPEKDFPDFIGPYRRFLTQQKPDDYLNFALIIPSFEMMLDKFNQASSIQYRQFYPVSAVW